ncbi:MAG: hypothetical protein EOP49_44620, partial [Sphingobacteriales bacterium]
MKPAVIPPHLTGKELLEFLVKNEALILHAKKSEIKRADAVFYRTMYVTDKGTLVDKAQVETEQVAPSKLKAALVINTTNWLDSHGDVHIPGIWRKSLADNKRKGFYLLDCHQRAFDKVIADSCEGTTKNLLWQELGFNIPGATEALIFTGIIEKDRNPFMFDQYLKGYVKEHSVGMRYIKMVTCIDDEDYPVQKENWDKYIEMVANREDAEASGYFWAVLEAQVMEGSAVLFGSNCMTPAMSLEDITDNSSKNHSRSGTDNQPDHSTEQQPQDTSKGTDYEKIANTILSF